MVVRHHPRKVGIGEPHVADLVRKLGVCSDCDITGIAARSGRGDLGLDGVHALHFERAVLHGQPTHRSSMGVMNRYWKFNTGAWPTCRRDFRALREHLHVARFVIA